MRTATIHSPPSSGIVRPGDAHCVLDLVHLSRQTMGDRALETELLELFDKQAAGAMARLAGPLGTAGSAGADIAHMLKGSARAVGAFEVASTAEAVEQALRAGVAAVRPLADLEDAVEEARRTVAALLN